MGRRIAGWAAVLFIGYYIVTDSTAAAHTTHVLLGGITDIAQGLSSFISQL